MNLTIKSRAALSAAIFLAASAHVRAQVAATNLPPMPPVPSYRQVNSGLTLQELSPVVYFRGILGMTPAERTNALAGKSADYKKAVLDKVQEYQALPKDIREARLHETQLRWDLISLMKLPPASRPALLKDLAAQDRALLEDRLRQWDQLPTDMQKAFLEKESFLDFYLRWLASSAAEQQVSLNNLPPNRRQELTNELARWQTLSEATRRRLCDQFHQFFEQDQQQQNQTLTTFTAAERKAMETALMRFASLSADQRKACIDSFQKFATMAPQERNQFLKNANRWEAMTSDERILWRTLVHSFPVMPPMPPVLGSMRFPPMPPGMKLTPPMPPGMNPPALDTPPPPTNAVAPAKLAGARN
jgi:hypothetical protein